MMQSPTLENIIQGMESRGVKLALRDAIIVAACDGDFQVEEIELIGKIADAADVSEEILAQLFDWAGRGWDWLAESRLMLDIPLPSEIVD
jgi:hypothetical protein